MNAGEWTVDWLYREQLKIDAEWSVRNKNGFTWWADRNAQRVEVIGVETNDQGEKTYLIRVKTEMLRDVYLTEKVLELINAMLMPYASMSGPVYDKQTKVLSLSSLILVHEGVKEWMAPLISMAAVLQVGESRIMGPELAEPLGAIFAESGHPVNGLRPQPDEMAGIITTLVAPHGQEPSAWKKEEFEEAVAQYMQQWPSLGATSGGSGLTVEFPYGDASSLCRFYGDQPHPRYGNGLLLVQSFPVNQLSNAAGAKLALELNNAELDRKPTGYGFGSYCYRDATIHFTGFLPNVLHRKGLLSNLYISSGTRAREISRRFTGNDWSDPSRGQSAATRIHKGSKQ